ncbi:hypothetical protein [Fodinicola feengrottensis]|uniref:hypothetical protein n=1 Tax=Fodinicola feengrottensis TaxID=435914 RepID=UPI0013D73A34|nr:hypothetical protein [Fodinicola feengrottensis]
MNTGFALPRSPATPLSPDYALATGGRYLFWLDIGRLVAESIERTPMMLPPGLPTGAVLTVALFLCARRNWHRSGPCRRAAHVAYERNGLRVVPTVPCGQ